MAEDPNVKNILIAATAVLRAREREGWPPTEEEHALQAVMNERAETRIKEALARSA
jgi:hypothetical protein